MAVVLEIQRRGQSAPQFVRVSDAELANGLWLGRGYDCDVLLADPHVEARHARLVSIDGRLVVTASAGTRLSLNRVAVEQAREVSSGATLSLGHTQVRVFDASHPVAPAQATDAFVDGLAWFTQLKFLLPMLVLVYGVHVLDITSRQTTELDVLSAMLAGVAPILLCLGWAGLWALVTRVLKHEARFTSHLAIALLASAASPLLDLLAELLEYNSQSLLVREWTDHFTLATLFAALLVLHVRVTLGPLRWFWRLPAVTVALAFVGFDVLSDVARERDFRSSPEYSSIVLPDSLRWRSEVSSAHFIERADDLFDLVNAERERLAREAADREAADVETKLPESTVRKPDHE